MSVYKECDIRGVYGEELSDDMAFDIGRAVGTVAAGRTVLVCGDVRVSTPALKERLTEGLLASGARVVDIGLSPTPVFYFGKKYLGAWGGVMVTASHNPAQYNGFKLMLGGLPVLPSDIAEIERIVRQRAFADGDGSLDVADDIEDAYARATESLLDGKNDGGFKIVLDCCDGTTSRLAPAMFRRMGYGVVELFCGWDGTFPNRDPNPAVYTNLAALQKKVAETGAQMGAAFDGDGDRVVFCDEAGRVLMSEQALVLLVREYLKDAPSSVVYDLKSSSIVARETEALGGEAVMERSGHAFIKRAYLQRGSALAGEISGHFFFRELGGDDGIYAALKLAQIVSKSGKSLSALVDGIAKTVITPDIRIPWPYEKQDELVGQIQALERDYPVTGLDGVRVDFGFGWALVRKSVTEQAVTVRAEADSEGQVARILRILAGAAPGLDVPALWAWNRSL